MCTCTSGSIAGKVTGTKFSTGTNFSTSTGTSFGTVFQYKYIWSKTSLLATHAGWLGTSRPHFWFVFLATRAAQSGLPTKTTVLFYDIYRFDHYLRPYSGIRPAVPWPKSFGPEAKSKFKVRYDTGTARFACSVGVE